MTPDQDGRVTAMFADDGVVTVRIDRPAKLNALTLEIVDQFAGVIAEIRSSRARIVVLRTAGDRAFSVGADIAQFATFDPQDMWRHWIAEGHRVFRELAELRQPTIAVVDGIAVGGGLELALACDFRVAVESATFGLPETGIGTIPGWGGTGRLTRLVGAARASELILARRRIGAERALAWGLVTEIQPAAELDAAVDRLVDDLLGGADLAQQASKQLIRAAAAGADAAILESLASGFTAGASDFAEGVSAFLEKRPPQFSRPRPTPTPTTHPRRNPPE